MAQDRFDKAGQAINIKRTERTEGLFIQLSAAARYYGVSRNAVTQMAITEGLRVLGEKALKNGVQTRIDFTEIEAGRVEA
jgi:hypothetical protein